LVLGHEAAGEVVIVTAAEGNKATWAVAVIAAEALGVVTTGIAAIIAVVAAAATVVDAI